MNRQDEMVSDIKAALAAIQHLTVHVTADGMVWLVAREWCDPGAAALAYLMNEVAAIGRQQLYARTRRFERKALL